MRLAEVIEKLKEAMELVGPDETVYIDAHTKDGELSEIDFISNDAVIVLRKDN